MAPAESLCGCKCCSFFFLFKKVAVAGLCGGAYLLCAYADTEMPAGLLKVRFLRVAKGETCAF